MTSNQIILRVVCCTALLINSLNGRARAQKVASGSVIHVSSRLVVLDVTVLDKKGTPMMSGLTRDDFTVKEDKGRQEIVSFEAPGLEKQCARAASDGPAASATAPRSSCWTC